MQLEGALVETYQVQEVERRLRLAQRGSPTVPTHDHCNVKRCLTETALVGAVPSPGSSLMPCVLVFCEHILSL